MSVGSVTSGAHDLDSRGGDGEAVPRPSAAARTVRASLGGRMRLQDRVSPRRLPIALFVVAVSTLAGLVTADSELEVTKVVSQPFAVELTTLDYTITVSNPSAPDNDGPRHRDVSDRDDLPNRRGIRRQLRDRRPQRLVALRRRAYGTSTTPSAGMPTSWCRQALRCRSS